MNLTEAHKLVILAALRLLQDNWYRQGIQVATGVARADRILFFEQESRSAVELLDNDEAMDALWDAINENELTINYPQIQP